MNETESDSIKKAVKDIRYFQEYFRSLPETAVVLIQKALKKLEALALPEKQVEAPESIVWLSEPEPETEAETEVAFEWEEVDPLDLPTPEHDILVDAVAEAAKSARAARVAAAAERARKRKEQKAE